MTVNKAMSDAGDRQNVTSARHPLQQTGMALSPVNTGLPGITTKEPAMWKRLTLLWTLLRGDARRLWFALRHPAAPSWLKLGCALIALYVISPIDLIPDVLPIVGMVDDLVLVPLAIRWLLNRLPAELTQPSAKRRPR